MEVIELTQRQEQILQIVKEEGPITGEQIADRLSLTRATLRPDLAILTMAGFLEARPRVGYFYTGKTGMQLLGEHIRKMRVNDYKAHPIVIQESSSVFDAISTLFLEDVGTLYVVNQKGYLSGVISRKDLLRAAMGKHSLEDVAVHIIMTRMPNIVMCSIEETLFEAARKLISYQIDSLPVVKEHQADGRVMYEVVGRITKTTITRAFVELGENQDI
ncbi:MAG: helix-turn-helix transcriptional regulator [Bacillaceae bacterium]|nr:helix-turn-helix transcriptional regulator [Bacillaceae bacterium]